MPHTISENLVRLQTARTNIANAITAKGGTVTTGDGFEEFSADIATIPSGGVEFSATPKRFALITNIKNLDAVIPNGVTSITSAAFQNCTGLTSIEIPSSVTSIGNTAFYGCTGLTSIVIPSSVTDIGITAFYACTGLTDIIISNGVINISTNAFLGCTGLTSVEIPSSVTSIAGNAFSVCTNLTAITIHKAEGSITGAPWGATNATVIWDG